MDGLDPNIPLAAGRQVYDPMRSMAGAYQLAGAMREQRQAAQQQADQQTLQQALQNGANFSTPDGIAKAAEQLKGRVSPDMYARLVQSGQQMAQSETERQINLSRIPQQQLVLQQQQNAAIQNQLKAGMSQYDQDVKQYGEQEAARRYGEYKKQIIGQLGQQKAANGQPMFPPNLLQQYANSNYNQDMAALEGVDYHQKQLKAAADLQAEKAETELRYAQAQKARRMSQAETLGAVSPMGEVLHGEDLLKSLPAGVGATVKAIAEGRQDITSIPSRQGQREKMSELVNLYDPTWSAAGFKTKAALQKDFTSGKAAQNITSINTAIGHIGTLSELGKALQNNDVQTVNAVVNRISQEFGNPNITNFNLAKTAVGEEMMRTFRGVGASVTEAEQWKSNFDTAQTPQQLQSAVRTGVHLLESRIGALDAQYKRGMGTEKGYKDILDQESVDTLYRLTGKDYSKEYNVGEPTSLKGREGAGTTSKEKPREFRTVAEAQAAGLKPGTRVVIGGRSGTWR